MSMIAVARAAGVSTATVSRVLNNAPGVRPETVEQVRAAAKSLNYRLRGESDVGGPRRRPRSSRGSSTGNVAILTIGQARDWLQLPVMASVVAGVQRATAELGLRLLLDEVTDFSQQPALVTERRIDGAVVFVGSSASQDAAARFLRDASAQMPIVWVMGVPTGADGVDHVTYDNMGVGHLAFQHLKSKGCREFAFFTDRPDWRLFRMRGQSFSNAAFDQRLMPTSFLVTSDELLAASFGRRVFHEPTFEQCIDRMLDTMARPAGIFVANDATVVPMYLNLMQRKGIRIGEDVHMVSCDNEELRLATLHPRPASIDLSGGEIGFRAVSRLRARQQRPGGSPVLIQVQPTLNEIARL